jgi:hypothetical protein
MPLFRGAGVSPASLYFRKNAVESMNGARPRHPVEEVNRPLTPVEEILGARTLAVVRSFSAADAAILKRRLEPRPADIGSYQRLTEWRNLSAEQLSGLRATLLHPSSYWTGAPVYRRFPHRPGFALRLVGASDSLHLLVDLQNPGWDWYCGEEKYSAFSFAGPWMSKLAKDLFPEYASPSRSAVWKRGAIEILAKDAPATRRPLQGD